MRLKGILLKASEIIQISFYVMKSLKKDLSPVISTQMASMVRNYLFSVKYEAIQICKKQSCKNFWNFLKKAATLNLFQVFQGLSKVPSISTAMMLQIAPGH